MFDACVAEFLAGFDDDLRPAVKALADRASFDIIYQSR